MFEEVVRSLRDFLLELEQNDSASFELLRSEIADEWLWLDSLEGPTVGQLYFLGEVFPSDEARRILGEWWEAAQDILRVDTALLPSEFTSFSEVSLATGRTMSLLTHWYLSEDA